MPEPTKRGGREPGSRAARGDGRDGPHDRPSAGAAAGRDRHSSGDGGGRDEGHAANDRHSASADGGRGGWEPVAEVARHRPPAATVDPDRSLPWFRRLLPLVRARRGLVAASVLAAVGAMVAQVATPILLRSAIDRALLARTTSLTPFVVALLALSVARAVLAYASRAGLFRMAYDVEFDLRTLLYEHLTRLSFSFYDRVQSGQVISRANSDIRSVQMVLAFAPLIAVSITSFAVALVVMLTISVSLTLVAVAALPGVYLAGVALRNRIFPLSWIVQGRMAEVATVVDENVNGVRVVKAFAGEERQVRVLARAAQRLRWASVVQADARARWAPVMENLPRLSLALVLLYGGWLAVDGGVTIGTLVAFNAYVLVLQAPFRMLGFFLMLAQRAAASAQRIYEVLDEPVEIVDRPGAVDLVDPRGAVELRGVRFRYGDGPLVLDGLDLRVEPGETVALVGETGSGKSTVARLLARFYDVDGGVVLLDGHDVRDLTQVSVRAAVGIVPDEPFLFSAAVRDAVAFGRPTATDDEVRAAAEVAQAAGFVGDLPDGWATVIGERGYDLSGGQRQRLSLARTLLADPAVLVLDDATSAVDVGVEERIHEGLRRNRAGRTTIVIAHRLSTIALADRVVLLDGGRAVATGTHADLLAGEPRYAAVLATTAAAAAGAAADGRAG
ncbi:MAG TPA: ABC transporter transmembrane domain-containing protein [Acidimicrobiales bacterium]